MKLKNNKKLKIKQKSNYELSKTTKADFIEKEILKNGTKKDKINTLTLLIEKDPINTTKELQELLRYCENDRNEVVFYVLKNIKDLMLSSLKDIKVPLKRKLVGIFKLNVRNSFIKAKVVDLIGELLKRNILFLELIYIFIDKIGDSKEISLKVQNVLKYLLKNESMRNIIVEGIQELYLKSEDRKVKLKCIMFFKNIDVWDSKIFKNLYETILKDLESCDNAGELLAHVFEGILKLPNDDFPMVNKKLLKMVNFSTDLEFFNLKILSVRKHENLYSSIINSIKRGNMLNYKDVPSYFNIILNYILEESEINKQKEVLDCLLKYSFLFSVEVLLSALIVLSVCLRKCKNLNFKFFYILSSLRYHYHPLVRYVICEILNEKSFDVFDPFDVVGFKSSVNRFKNFE